MPQRAALLATTVLLRSLSFPSTEGNDGEHDDDIRVDLPEAIAKPARA